MWQAHNCTGLQCSHVNLSHAMCSTMQHLAMPRPHSEQANTRKQHVHILPERKGHITCILARVLTSAICCKSPALEVARWPHSSGHLLDVGDHVGACLVAERRSAKLQGIEAQATALPQEALRCIWALRFALCKWTNW